MKEAVYFAGGLMSGAFLIVALTAGLRGWPEDKKQPRTPSTRKPSDASWLR